MIYTEWTKKAMKLAYKAHHGQVDKGGMPYVFHPFHLAEQMDDEISTVAALLHDVVEDVGGAGGRRISGGVHGGAAAADPPQRGALYGLHRPTPTQPDRSEDQAGRPASQQ